MISYRARRHAIVAVAAVVAAASLLAACGGDDDDAGASERYTTSTTAEDTTTTTGDPTTTAEPGTTTTGDPGTTATTSPGPAGLEATLSYTRSGGIAGFHEVLTIQPDGTAHLTNRSGGEPGVDFTLTQQEYDEVAGALEQSNFDQLPQDTTGAQIADAFTYMVDYAGRRVRTEDTQIPPDMDPLIAALQGIADSHQPS